MRAPRLRLIAAHKQFIIDLKQKLVRASSVQEAAVLRARISAAYAKLQIILNHQPKPTQP
jgi:hypothetical protein